MTTLERNLYPNVVILILHYSLLLFVKLHMRGAVPYVSSRTGSNRPILLHFATFIAAWTACPLICRGR